jgi:hypothetical protein
MTRRTLVLWAACAAGPFVNCSLAQDGGGVEPATALPPTAQVEPAGQAQSRPPAVEAPAVEAPAVTPGDDASRPATQPVTPKPISPNVAKGLDWIVQHQLANGAWGQGEESQHMGGGGQLKDVASVADTAVATLALLRSGSSPRDGEHATPILRAVVFLCEQVEKSDDADLFVTDNRGTRVQSKLGPHIDTFLTALVLTEAKDRMPDDASNQRVALALQKVTGKIEKNVQQDGQWTKEGWAPVLANGLAGRAFNAAAQKGVRVDADKLAMVNSTAQKAFEDASVAASPAAMGGAGGAAGVELYARSANLGQLQAAQQTARDRKSQIEEALNQPTTQPEQAAALRAESERLDGQLKAGDDARRAVVERMRDERFVAGFGSNGGEEFLSYMTIGEALLAEGGEQFAQWDQSMTQNLTRVQNDDGSWSGHHCITGKTFCTSTALLTLLTDRAAIPLAQEIRPAP